MIISNTSEINHFLPQRSNNFIRFSTSDSIPVIITIMISTTRENHHDRISIPDPAAGKSAYMISAEMEEENAGLSRSSLDDLLLGWERGE